MAFNETIPNNYIKEVTIEYSSECLPSLSENSNQQEIMNFSNSEKSQAFSDLNQDNFYNIKSKSKSKLSTQIMTPLSNPHREIKNRENKPKNKNRKNIEILNDININNSKDKIIKKKIINKDNVDNILLNNNICFFVEIKNKKKNKIKNTINDIIKK